METARCEALGARDMPGTAGNIDAKIASETDRVGYRDIKDRSDAPLSDAAGFLIRSLATGRELPEGAQNVLNLWRDFLETQAGKTIENVSNQLEDQNQFAKFARQVITDLGYGDQLGNDPDNLDDEDEEEFQDDADEESNPDSTGDEDSQDEESDANPEQSQEEQQDAGQASVSLDDDTSDDMSEETELPEGRVTNRTSSTSADF